MRTEIITAGGCTAVFAGDERDAGADVTERDAAVEIHLHTRGGHVAPDVRAVLMETVFQLPEVRGHRHLFASVPIGDTQFLELLRRRCDTVHTRAAGATCLVDAELGATRD